MQQGSGRKDQTAGCQMKYAESQDLFCEKKIYVGGWVCADVSENFIAFIFKVTSGNKSLFYIYTLAQTNIN